MLIPTHHDLSQDVRQKEVEFLNRRLADSIDLVYQAKQAHWNVKGAEFRSLHKLFDQVAETVDEYVDLFAERIVQLGGVAEGTVQSAVRVTSLPEYPLDLLDGMTHVRLLCEHTALYAAYLRQGIQFSTDLEDQVTVDILTDGARDIDKLVWMMESHLFGQGEIKQAAA